MQEFEIEMERLSSRMEHLKSQNEVLTLSLAESRAHSDRLTVLLGQVWPLIQFLFTFSEWESWRQYPGMQVNATPKWGGYNSLLFVRLGYATPSSRTETWKSKEKQKMFYKWAHLVLASMNQIWWLSHLPTLMPTTFSSATKRSKWSRRRQWATHATGKTWPRLQMRPSGSWPKLSLL